MFAPFKLKSSLGRSYNVDLGDIRRTKEALHTLGYYAIPSYGLTEYPDDLLFSGIETFQRAHGLQRDGIMHPGGETEKALRARLASKRWSDLNSASDPEAAPEGGPFTSTVAIADAAVAVSAVVVIDVAVIGHGPDGDLT